LSRSAELSLISSERNTTSFLVMAPTTAGALADHFGQCR
jgi:hypothetical protein